MPALRASLLTRVGSAAAVAVLAGGGVIATATAADAASHHSKLRPTTCRSRTRRSRMGSITRTRSPECSGRTARASRARP